MSKSKGRITVSGKFVFVDVAVNIFKEDNYYIADCPALKLSTQGRSIPNVKSRFHEALELWIESTFKVGSISKALEELGWKKTSSCSGLMSSIVSSQVQNMPKLIPPDINYRQVPIELIAQEYCGIPVPAR